MNIALIDPPAALGGLNIGLAYIAGVLTHHGHHVAVIDLNNRSDSVEERLLAIRDYDYIGISVKSVTAGKIAKICQLLQRDDLICGGPHIAIDGENFMCDHPSFEMGVIGEGELFWEKLVQGHNLSAFPGVLYREELSQQNARAKASTPVSDIHTLPLPDYHSFDSVSSELSTYPLISSRGCPYACGYCSVPIIIGKKWRARTPKSVVAEIEHAIATFGANWIEIFDDNFTLNVKRAKEICRLIVSRKLPVSLSCPNGIRADCIDEELVQLMKEAGFHDVSVGIESANLSVFSKINKGETIEDITRATRLFSKYQIPVKAFFIVGLPGDTLEGVKKSIRFIRQSGHKEAIFNMFSPYPATPFWEWVHQHGTWLLDWKEGFHFGNEISVVFETEEFSAKERVIAYKYANLACFNYHAFIDESKPLVKNVFSVVYHIFRYDIWHLANHIGYIVQNSGRIVRRIIAVRKLSCEE